MSAPGPVLIGVAWYREDQWSLLRALSADPEQLEVTYAEWLAGVTKTVADLRREGFSAVKVDVEVLELAKWCQTKGIALDGKARASYAVERLRVST